MKEADLVLVDDNFAIRNIIRAFTGTIAKRKGMKLNIYSHPNAVSGFGDIYAKDANVLVVDTTLPKYSPEEIVSFISNKSKTKKSTKVILLAQHELDFIVPKEYKVFIKSSPTFLVDLLEEIADSLGITFSFMGSTNTNRFVIHIGNLALYWASTADKLIGLINRNNFFLNIVSFYPILLFTEIIVSTLMTVIYITIGRISDASIERAYQEESRFKFRYFPVVIGFTLMTTLIISQALRVVVPNDEQYIQAQHESLEILPVTGDIVIESRIIETSAEIGALLIPAIIVYILTLYTYPDVLVYLLDRIKTRKKVYPWGIIYNSETLRPVEFTEVKLYYNDRLHASTVTDHKGRYGFKVKTGIYDILVQDPNYLKHSDSIKVESYTSPEVHIPLEKDKDRKRTLINIKNVNTILLGLGAFLSLGYVFFTISFTATLILGFYAAQLVYSLLTYYNPPWGVVFNSNTKLLVKGAITKLYRDNDSQLLDVDITDTSGQFSFRIKEGNYYLQIEHPYYRLDNDHENSLLDIVDASDGKINFDRHKGQKSYLHVPMIKR